MNQEIRSKIQSKNLADVKESLKNEIDKLASEGYEVSFGKIGSRTTYALLTRDNEEIVGYTYIKDLKYANDTIGEYRALQQALARKEIKKEKTEG